MRQAPRDLSDGGGAKQRDTDGGNGEVVIHLVIGEREIG